MQRIPRLVSDSKLPIEERWARLARVERRHRRVMATLLVVCPTAFFALGWYIGGVVAGLVLVAFWSLMAATNWLYRLARGEI